MGDTFRRLLENIGWKDNLGSYGGSLWMTCWENWIWFDKKWDFSGADLPSACVSPSLSLYSVCVCVCVCVCSNAYTSSGSFTVGLTPTYLSKPYITFLTIHRLWSWKGPLKSSGFSSTSCKSPFCNYSNKWSSRLDWTSFFPRQPGQRLSNSKC